MDELIQVNETFETQVDPHIMQMEVFRQLVKRDKGMTGDASGRHKLRSKKELAYIYLMNNPKSQYARNFPSEKERHEQIVHELGLPENWEIDKYLQRAIDAYRKAIEDPLYRLWRAGNSSIDKLQNYLNNVDLEEGEISIKDYMHALQNLDNVANNVDKLEKKIKERESGDKKTYGDVEETEFNT